MSEYEQGGAGGRAVQRAGGERNGAAAGRDDPRVGVPDPELVEGPRRRRFSAEYKLRIVREAEACTSRGEIGELLRREGLYSSLLTEWRRARDGGALAGLERPRGPKPNPLEAENARLRRRAERAEAELWKARRVIEVQGNVSALLEQLLGTEGASEPGSTER
jgi:transposase-like protein